MTEKYIIDNDTTIGRLLPWFARGRKLYDFLTGIAKPIVPIHLTWTSWAKGKIMESVLTFQPIVLNWFLHELAKDKTISASDAYVEKCQREYITIYDLSEHNPDDFLDDYVFNDGESETNAIFSDHGAIDIVGTKYTFYLFISGTKADNDSIEKIERTIRKIIDNYKTQKIEYKYVNTGY